MSSEETCTGAKRDGSLSNRETLGKAEQAPVFHEDRSDRLARETKGWKVSLLLAAALSMSGFIVPKLNWASGNHAAPVSNQQIADNVSQSGPDEIDTGAMCDLAVKRALASENSFDPEWGGSFHAEGKLGVMSRKFEATNGFGAKLTSQYTCKWDPVNDRIVSLTITDPFGETTKLR